MLNLTTSKHYCIFNTTLNEVNLIILRDGNGKIVDIKLLTHHYNQH